MEEITVSAEQSSLSVSKIVSAGGTTPKYLMTTFWNQSGKIFADSMIEFNEDCPWDVVRTDRCITGCANTASGQVIYYWIQKGYNFTFKLTSADRYVSKAHDLTIQINDTAASAAQYFYRPFSEVNAELSKFELTSAKDIAALNFYCGVVNRSEYSSLDTGASLHDSLFYDIGFVSIVDESENSYFIIKNGTKHTPTDAGWEVLIENIQAGRPILSTLPDHMVVFDGYDAATNSFHVNYGWGPDNVKTKQSDGTYSGTGWYTREEINVNNYDAFYIDIQPVYDNSVPLQITDARAYGTGTFLRALERSEAIRGKNFIEFSNSVDGKNLVLNELLDVSDDFVFNNFNMNISMRDSSFFTFAGKENVFKSISGGIAAVSDTKVVSAFDCSGKTSETLTIENLSGTLIANSAESASALSSVNAALNVTLDGGAIFAGSLLTGGSYIQSESVIRSALQAYTSGAGTGSLTNLLSAPAGYGVFARNDKNDSLTLKSQSVVVGDLYFGAGNDHLSFTDKSAVFGNLLFGEGADVIETDSTSIFSGIFFTNQKALSITVDLCADRTESSIFTLRSHAYNFVSAINESVTVNLHSGESTGVYSLIDAAGASDAESIKDLRFLVQSEGFSETLSLAGGETSVGKTAALSYESGKLLLTVTEPQKTDARADIDANGISDILMAHDAGYAGAWLIEKNQTSAWGNLSTLSGDWKLFGTGNTETSGDGHADVYLYSESLHSVGAWNVGPEGTVTNWKGIANFQESTRVIGVGDYNGDGQSDLLLQSTDGVAGVYFTDSGTWREFQALGPEWTLAGIGDFNGDGISDTILTNASGDSGTWLTGSDGSIAWTNLSTLGSFKIAGVGDFNGDGTDDVLLRKDAYCGVWTVKNGSVSAWMGLGEIAPANTSIEQIGDFNGDGMDDIRIRTSGGDIGAVQVLGEDKTQWSYYGGLGSEWTTSLASV